MSENDPFAVKMACPMCGNPEARMTLSSVKCPNKACANFDGGPADAPGRAAAPPIVPAPPAVSRIAESAAPFDPKANRIDIKYRNFRGEEKAFVGDRATVRASGRHISVLVAPSGRRIALAKEKILNWPEVNAVVPSPQPMPGYREGRGRPVSPMAAAPFFLILLAVGLRPFLRPFLENPLVRISILLAGIALLYWLVVALRRMIFRPLVAEVLKKTFAQLPKEVHYEKKQGHVWLNEPAARALAQPLLANGFSDAGVFLIKEYAAGATWFLVNEKESVGASIVEHPKTGIWVNIFSRYKDGTSFWLSSLPDRGMGLGDPPGNIFFNAPGFPPDQLVQKLLKERKKEPLEAMTAENIARLEAEAHCRVTAWRQDTGPLPEILERWTNKRARLF